MGEGYAKFEYEHEFFLAKNMKPTYTRKGHTYVVNPFDYTGKRFLEK